MLSAGDPWPLYGALGVSLGPGSSLLSEGESRKRKQGGSNHTFYDLVLAVTHRNLFLPYYTVIRSKLVISAHTQGESYQSLIFERSCVKESVRLF